jgi:hypothetical protein
MHWGLKRWFIAVFRTIIITGSGGLIAILGISATPYIFAFITGPYWWTLPTVVYFVFMLVTTLPKTSKEGWWK